MLLCKVTASLSAQYDPVTFRSLLAEMRHPAALPAYQSNTVCAQTSSYDRTGGNDDGFSGKYSYIRMNPDSTLVIFEADGPGVINRIWTPTPSDDSLAFYIDDLTRPAFTINYRDLFSGKVFPFVPPLCSNQLGGFYCYLPIPFQSGCRIVYKGKRTQFYQVQYRQYPKGTKVEKFHLALNQGQKAALEDLRSIWTKDNRQWQDFYPEAGAKYIRQSIQPEPGKTYNLFQASEGGRILGIEFSPASAFEGLARQMDLRITWDGEKTPAVYCPAADFFGYAFGKASMNSLLIGSDGERAYCYFPMPYDRSAKVELIFRAPDGVELPALPAVQVGMLVTDEARNPQKEGRFYAHWNRNNPAVEGQPHIFLHAEGKGHYVGTALQAQGLQPGMTYFFEGDDSTVVDGTLRMHGTGSEDYFNGGWYALPDRWDAAMSLPLSGALDYSLPFCRTGGYRLFLSDKISFEKNIFHSIEHGPEGNRAPADYTSVAYYYCDRPPESAEKPTNATTGVYLPDTMMLFPQLLQMVIRGEVAVKPAWLYPIGGDSFLFTVSDNAAVRIPLEGVPAGTYRLTLDYIKDPAGCEFSVWQRQTQVSEWLDANNPTREREQKSGLCTVKIDPLVNTITLRFKAGDGRNWFGLNRVILVRE